MWPFKRSRWLGEGYDLAVVGLGNPGPEYDGTRHNVGFDCVDKFASEHGLKWTGRRGPLKWAEGRVTIEGSAKRVLLAKPRTFMNLSGEVVRYITTRWSVPEDKLLIIYDDMDLPLGTLRIRMQGSAGGHNGIKSIIRALGTENVPRIRVGIGRDATGRTGAIARVLSRFSDDERQAMDSSVSTVSEAIACILSKGLDAAMSQYN